MRQSANYKWNLPEDEDEIDVEDLNAVFTAVDEKLKTHDNELRKISLPGSIGVISASGSGSFYHGTTSGFVSLLKTVKTTYGYATFGTYHGEISGNPGTNIQLYVTLYISNAGVLCWDEHYNTYDDIEIDGNILSVENIGTVSIGDYESGGSTTWNINYINEQLEEEFEKEKEYSLREAINELALRIQALRSQGGTE